MAAEAAQELFAYLPHTPPRSSLPPSLPLLNAVFVRPYDPSSIQDQKGEREKAGNEKKTGRPNAANYIKFETKDFLAILLGHNIFFSFYSIFPVRFFPCRKKSQISTQGMWAGPPTRKIFRGRRKTADDVIHGGRCYAIRCGQGMPMIFSPHLSFLGSGAPMGPAHKNSKFRVHF